MLSAESSLAPPDAPSETTAIANTYARHRLTMLCRNADYGTRLSIIAYGAKTSEWPLQDPDMVVNAEDRHDDEAPEEKAARPERKRRRVSEDIFQAFHFACDIKDLEVAQRLLAVVETMLSKQANRSQEGSKQETKAVVAAHERLWSLRRPQDR